VAVSRIHVGCSRYGCIKNLLACYANCRYNTRCDDLRNEVLDKLDEANRDINQYLSERSAISATHCRPIAIRVLKQGLRFVEASDESTKHTA
jgi:hypothetical protein